MLAVEKYVLAERYRLDSGVVYDLTEEQLQVLLQELGEIEPIIDAINVLAGANYEQRAAAIGCSAEDFWRYDE